MFKSIIASSKFYWAVYQFKYLSQLYTSVCVHRKSNSKVMETAQYVRKLSSKPPSLSSSMSSNSGRPYGRPGRNPLLATPIPGSGLTRTLVSTVTSSASLTSSTHSVQSATKSKTSASIAGKPSSFYDEIERHRLASSLTSRPKLGLCYGAGCKTCMYFSVYAMNTTQFTQ